MKTRMVLGDCIEKMKELPDNSVDAVVTDPPYELGFMGKDWDNAGIAYNVAMWQECLRVLKPGGHLLSFGGTRTYHRMACAIEDAGFEIRDSIHWMYGSGFPKSLNIGGGKGTALKPSHEPIVVARKPLTGTIAANVLSHGTGALNIGGCRVGSDKRLNNSSGTPGTGRMRACNLVDRGDGKTPDGRDLANALAYVAQSKHREPTEVTGRWPSNTLFSHLPECDENTCAETCAVAELDAQSDDSGGASRFFPVFRYQAKASRKERDAGLTHLPGRSGAQAVERTEGSAGTKSPRAGAGRTAEHVKNHHPTVKPVDLMRWLVRLVTPPGGLILDPFAGSGTTGVAAKLEGFQFVGIEQSPEYHKIALFRIAGVTPENVTD